MSDLLTQATTAVVRSIGDLADFPLYVCPQQADRMPAGAAACTMPMDPLWRSRLEAAGTWQGIGRLVVVNDAMLSLPLDYLVGCLVHEVSHLLPPQTPVMIGETIPDAVALCAALESRDAAIPVDSWPGAGEFWHGAAFCRRLLHVRHRVQCVTGRVLPFDTLGVYCGPCHLSMMSKRLGSEPQRLKTATFAEMEDIKPPAEFSALWNATRKER